MHVAQRFELFLDAYRRPDGSRWTGQKLDEAKGGVVRRSYVTNLRKGRIESPGYEKMLAIARVMGFPPALWFEDAPGEGTRAAPEKGQDLAGIVGHLFADIRHPRTGEPYTDADVARMSAGVLTEEVVEGIRTGEMADPTVARSRRSRPYSACTRPTWWSGTRGRRSWTRRRSTPWPTRPPQRYSGRAPVFRRGRSGSSSG